MNWRVIPFVAVMILALAPAFAAAAKQTKPTPALTAEALLSQAQAAMGKGDTELAVRLAQSAIVADPARPGAYVALGNIYADAGEPDYARSFYEAALNIDPTDPSALKAEAKLDRTHPEATANAAK